MDLLNWRAGLLAGMPYNTSEKTTTPMQQGGFMQGLIGLGGTILGGPIGGALGTAIAGKLFPGQQGG